MTRKALRAFVLCSDDLRPLPDSKSLLTRLLHSATPRVTRADAFVVEPPADPGRFSVAAARIRWQSSERSRRSFSRRRRPASPARCFRTSLESLPAPIPTIYSAGHRERAEILQA